MEALRLLLSSFYHSQVLLDLDADGAKGGGLMAGSLLPELGPIPFCSLRFRLQC